MHYFSPLWNCFLNCTLMFCQQLELRDAIRSSLIQLLTGCNIALLSRKLAFKSQCSLHKGPWERFLSGFRTRKISISLFPLAAQRQMVSPWKFMTWIFNTNFTPAFIYFPILIFPSSQFPHLFNFTLLYSYSIFLLKSILLRYNLHAMSFNKYYHIIFVSHLKAILK